MKSFSTIIVTIGFMLIAQQTIAKDTTTRGLRTQHNKRLNTKHKQTNNDIDIIAKEDVAFFTQISRGLSLPPTPRPPTPRPTRRSPLPPTPPITPFPTEPNVAPSPVAPPSMLVTKSELDGEVDEVQQANIVPQGYGNIVQNGYANIVPNRGSSRSSGKSGKGSGKSGKASSGKSGKGSGKSSKGSSGSGGHSRRQY